MISDLRQILSFSCSGGAGVGDNGYDARVDDEQDPSSFSSTFSLSSIPSYVAYVCSRSRFAVDSPSLKGFDRHREQPE